MSEEHQKLVREGKFLDLPHLDKEEYEEKVGTQIKWKQPKSFSLWLDLFLQYASVRIQAHPSDGPHLLGYIQIIKNLAEKEETVVWQKYDTDFRKLKASNPAMLWGDLNVQMLYKYLPGRNTSTPAPAKESTSSTSTRGSGARSQRVPFRAPSGGTPPAKACLNYYVNGWCTSFKTCTHDHICGHCHGKHSLKKCPKSTSSPPNRSTDTSKSK
jgi:hypothetical protein